MDSNNKIELSGSDQVTQYIQNLNPDLGVIIATLRQIILSTDDSIGERIKWNNPSFYYTGDMPPFDPKEYKREMIVFNLYKERILLVFPSGAKIQDTTGLLQGHYKDGRKTIIFQDLNDVQNNKLNLQAIIKKWLQHVDE